MGAQFGRAHGSWRACPSRLCARLWLAEQHKLGVYRTTTLTMGHRNSIALGIPLNRSAASEHRTHSVHSTLLYVHGHVPRPSCPAIKFCSNSTVPSSCPVRGPRKMDLSTAYRYNASMMEYYSCKIYLVPPSYASDLRKGSVPHCKIVFLRHCQWQCQAAASD